MSRRSPSTEQLEGRGAEARQLGEHRRYVPRRTAQSRDARRSVGDDGVEAGAADVEDVAHAGIGLDADDVDLCSRGLVEDQRDLGGRLQLAYTERACVIVGAARRDYGEGGYRSYR